MVVGGKTVAGWVCDRPGLVWELCLAEGLVTRLVKGLVKGLKKGLKKGLDPVWVMSELPGPTGRRHSCPPPFGLLLYLAATPGQPRQQRSSPAHCEPDNLHDQVDGAFGTGASMGGCKVEGGSGGIWPTAQATYLATSGRWGIWRRGIKEEPEGRGTAAEPNAPPA